MDKALDAVCLLDSAVWDVGSSVLRQLTGAERGSARHVALRLACELGDARLAAELIETARLAALPDRSVAPETVIFPRGIDNAEVARRLLGDLHPLEVGGLSRLRDHYPTDFQLGSPINLDIVIDALGGEQGWWWGSWLGAHEVPFWAVRDPAGRYHAGHLDTIDDARRTLLAEALMSTPSSGDDMAAQRGRFNATYASEATLSAELGQLLIPPPLRIATETVAAMAPAERTPLSVVVASNYLALLPVILFGAGTDPVGCTVRLLEVAVCRTAPPAVLVNQLLPAQPSAVPYPTAIVCSDPTDDLEFATLPLYAAAVYGGREVCAQHAEAQPATRGNLVAALREVPNPRAVFGYSGHCNPGHLGADLACYLALQDGKLTAETIFVGDADGQPIPFCERVLLSACDSAGSSGAGSGEWLGLTAAVLCNGAREVIATSWPVWDLPVTRVVDVQLMEALSSAEDIAAALREVQLTRLAEWRSSTSDYSERPVPEGAPESLPLVWSAYQYVGLPPLDVGRRVAGTG